MRVKNQISMHVNADSTTRAFRSLGPPNTGGNETAESGTATTEVLKQSNCKNLWSSVLERGQHVCKEMDAYLERMGI